MTKPTTEVLEERIEHLASLHESNAGKIIDLERRLAGYDRMAAKWGGVLLAATTVGTIVMAFIDKISNALIGVRQ